METTILVGKRKPRLVKIDSHWLPELSKYKWSCNSKYAIAKDENSNLIYMHRIIAGASKGEIVDHKNSDSFDNRESNLRKCTKSQNTANSKSRIGSSSKYKGVTFHSNGHWMARITVNYKNIYLGFYDSPELAAKKYDEAAILYFGEFALLNFPIVVSVQPERCT